MKTLGTKSRMNILDNSYGYSHQKKLLNMNICGDLNMPQISRLFEIRNFMVLKKHEKDEI